MQSPPDLPLLSGGDRYCNQLNSLFLPPLIAIFVITKAAGVVEMADGGADADDATDGLDGSHKARFAENDAAGLWSGEVGEEQMLL